MNKDERRYIANLIEHMGAEVLVSLIPLPEVGEREIGAARVAAQEQVDGCEGCSLGATATHHCPAEWPGRQPRQPAKFAVVGEAPGPEEDARGRPWVGKAGQLLRGSLMKFGVHANDDIAYVNAVSCFPHDVEIGPRGNEKKVIRPPTDAEMLACYRNFKTQLAAAHVKYVLLCGSTALKLWRKDLRITQQQGRLGIMDNRWYVFPILHPSAVLRGVETVGEWERRLYRFMEIVGDDEGTLALETKCGRYDECGERFYMYDMDGLPWCEGHWQQGVDGHERTVKWWAREVAKTDQTEMF